ncbi:hypothetical protein Leryth_018719 [Lithospermum erythrorhizon]|nr:hypothetical protein Leryth_018719 [Lithospermum erythrorhizon]
MIKYRGSLTLTVSQNENSKNEKVMEGHLFWSASTYHKGILYFCILFILQLLETKVGNHVEIGANTCIDRGSWRDTAIGDHTKIDNLVQIAHNVVIGKSCMICGQAGIAGSVTLGDYVTLGGRVGIRDHVCIGSNVRLAANSCVTKDIKEPGDYGGFPAIPIHKWRRQVARYRRTTK